MKPSRKTHDTPAIAGQPPDNDNLPKVSSSQSIGKVHRALVVLCIQSLILHSLTRPNHRPVDMVQIYQSRRTIGCPDNGEMEIEHEQPPDFCRSDLLGAVFLILIFYEGCLVHRNRHGICPRFDVRSRQDGSIEPTIIHPDGQYPLVLEHRLKPCRHNLGHTLSGVVCFPL